MKPWVDLYRQHRASRHMNDREAAREVRVVLRRLSEKPCPLLMHHAQSRLIEARDASGASVTYTLGRERAGESLNLDALPAHVCAALALERARLSVLLRFDRKAERLQELNIMLDGARRDGTVWAIGVHLPNERETPERPRGDREGLGACGHAALHCHVGPGLDAEPKVRVPFPPLRPAQIVEWAVSQAVPSAEFEPAPWPEVEAMLRPS